MMCLSLYLQERQERQQGGDVMTVGKLQKIVCVQKHGPGDAVQ